MKLLVLCILVVIGPNCFQEVILTQTLQVLRQKQEGGRRSSRSSCRGASAARVEFRTLFSDPSSRVAAAAWSEVAKHEESPFLMVPRKERNGWKVFLCFCSVYSTVYSMYVFWKVLGFRVNVRFLEIVV